MTYKVRDRAFDTLEAIAAEFGISLKRVKRAFSEGRQDRLGLPRGCKGVSVTIDDVDYLTISGASAETGIRPSTIRKYISEGRADELSNWNQGREWIEVGGKRYRTWAEAVEATGWSRATLNRHKRAGRLKDLKPKK